MNRDKRPLTTSDCQTGTILPFPFSKIINNMKMMFWGETVIFEKACFRTSRSAKSDKKPCFRNGRKSAGSGEADQSLQTLLFYYDLNSFALSSVAMSPPAPR